MTTSPAGFVLLDSALNALAYNEEAVRILAFPTKPDQIKRLGTFLTDKVKGGILSRKSGDGYRVTSEFRSGNRVYVCRAYSIDHHLEGSSRPAMAVLLERTAPTLMNFAQISEQFSLTQRERETVEYLLQGLTSKEIAERMNISPNTVKAFVRLVMVKMGTSTRSAIIGKIAGPRQ